MYTFISNLEDIEDLASTELHALSAVWLERKEQLQESGEYQDFLKKLQREWAIETGIIERLYTWDRGVTEVLIEQGIEASLIAHRGGVGRDDAENISSVIKDQYHVVEGLFAFVKGENPLSEHYIRTLHAEFTAHQEYSEAHSEDGRKLRVTLLKGAYKQKPNNPLRQNGVSHTYCPPEHVQQEMNHLMSWYGDLENNEAPPEVLSAFLHHRFTQIHPFQDGNGRVARALASIVFLKRGLFPLVIRDSDRKAYIGALEKADGGEMKPLCDLFARNQRGSILSAFGIEQSLIQARYAEEILSSGLQLLKNQLTAETNRMDEVFGYAEHLRDLTAKRLQSIAQLKNDALAGYTPPGQRPYRAVSESHQNDSDRRHWFRSQINMIAGRYNYRPSYSKYCCLAFITIQSLNSFQFVVSFHGVGHTHQGIMAASCFTLFRVPRDENQGTTPEDVKPASPDFFQFNYMESKENITKRYHDWLESSLAIAFAEWQRSIAREVR